MEQTIQRAVKDVSVVVGQQRKAHFVAEWNLIYHEVHAIKDVFNDLTNSNLNDSRDTIMHHELIGTAKSRLFNNMVQRTLEIIQSQGNVFSLHSPPQLRNMLTQQKKIYLRGF